MRTFDDCPSAYTFVVFQTYIRDGSSKLKQIWSAIKCCTLTGWMLEFGYPTLVKPLSPSAGLSLRASATQNYRSRLKIYLRRIRRGVEMSMWVRGKNPLLLPVTFPSASAWSWQWLAGETGRRHTLRRPGKCARYMWSSPACLLSASARACRACTDVRIYIYTFCNFPGF